MTPYKEWSPTLFDSPSPRQCVNSVNVGDWLVCPVICTRDSGPLERSNFNFIVQKLNASEEGQEWQRLSFNHWSPGIGWYDILIVKPGSQAATVATEIEARLERYPILDKLDVEKRVKHPSRVR